LDSAKNGAVFFSASSSTIEFNVQDPKLHLASRPEAGPIHDPVAHFQGKTLPLGSPSFDHHPKVYRYGDKELMFASAFHPVNLTGDPDPIAPELIQVTRALITLATLQLRQLPPGTKGIVPLDSEGQLLVLREYKKIVQGLGRKVPKIVRTLLDEGFAVAQKELAG
jgi:hypothetical protein